MRIKLFFLRRPATPVAFIFIFFITACQPTNTTIGRRLPLTVGTGTPTSGGSTSPAKLEFIVPPLALYANLPLSQSPVLVVKDLQGNVVSSSSELITVSVTVGTGTLTGNLSKHFINGVVNFTDLTYSASATGVVLRFTSGGLTLDTAPLSFTTAVGLADITPDDVSFETIVTHTPGPGGRTTSNTITVSGLNAEINASVSGEGTPRLRLNNGAPQTTLSNVKNTDFIVVEADAPLIHGGTHLITITLGGRTETFEIRYADPNVVAYAFVASGTTTGNNISNTYCNSKANSAGYFGNWMSMTTLGGMRLKDRLPFQWGVLKRLDGQVIANNWNQLWSGTLAHSISINELGNSSTAQVYTGVFDTSTTAATTPLSHTCNDWSIGSATAMATFGLSDSTSNTWMKSGLQGCDIARTVYCMSVPTGTQDTNPNDVSFTEVVNTTPSQRKSSEVATVNGVTTPILVSVGGASGNPKLKINGGLEVTSGTVGNGDQIQLFMDTPVVTGQKNIASLILGDDSASWWIGLADSTQISAVFVSSATYGGDLGGILGANTKCQTLATAQGFSGTWTAILETSVSPMKSNLPWNWGQLRRLDGAAVATSWADLWDGSIVNPINVSETLATQNREVWSGGMGNNDACAGFSVNGGGWVGQGGNSTQSTAHWLHSGTYNCSEMKSIYCMADFAGVNDSSPLPLTFTRKTTMNAGEVVDSDESTVGGITVPITAVLSGTQGNPVLKINGVASASTTATVQLGDKIKITMTAPTVAGTEYSNTLILGSDVYSIQLGYVDTSKGARVFVTSQTTSPGAGLSQFDSFCTSAAETAGLGGTWKALISTDSVDAKNRVPWNWNTLKLTDGTTLVANNWDDLWDGTLAHAIDMDENKNAGLNYYTATGTLVNGARSLGLNYNNWSSNNGVYKYGTASATNSNWITSPGASSSSQTHLYCIEDPSAPADRIPTLLTHPYKVFQEVSTRVASEPYVVMGLSTSVNLDLIDLSPGGIGNASYSVNGGLAQAPGATTSVNNGDSIVLSMDSPATLNSSHKLTFSIGDSGPIPWRVWSKGVTTGTLIKRIFVSELYVAGSLGGLVGADNLCVTEATLAGRGGQWKALLSGEKTDESSWAVNRMGYHWTELWTMAADGSPALRVLSAPNLWNNSTLENLPNTDEQGVIPSTVLRNFTNTNQYGFGIESGESICYGYINGSGTLKGKIYEGGFAGTLGGSYWINSNLANDSCYTNQRRLYCVEQ